jgi:hypothetical protein
MVETEDVPKWCFVFFDHLTNMQSMSMFGSQSFMICSTFSSFNRPTPIFFPLYTFSSVRSNCSESFVFFAFDMFATDDSHFLGHNSSFWATANGA